MTVVFLLFSWRTRRQISLFPQNNSCKERAFYIQGNTHSFRLVIVVKISLSMRTITCQEFPLLSCFFLLKYFTQHKPYSFKCVSLKFCFRGNILSLHRCFVEFGPQYSQKAPQCVQLPQKHPTSHLLSPLMISSTTLTQNFTLTPVSTYLLLGTGTLKMQSDLNGA